MKILYLSRGMSIGGAETNLRWLADELHSRGHEVTVASGAGRLTKDLEAIGVTHVTLRMSSQPLRLSVVMHDVRVVRRILREFKPDIAHVFGAPTSIVLWFALRCPPMASRPPAVPVISSIMGLQASPDEPQWRIWLRAFLTLLGSDRIVVISPAIDRLVRKLPVRRSRVVRQPVVGVRLPARCPPHSEKLRALRQELGIGKGDCVITTIGTLNPSKSHELFVQAAVQLLARGRNGCFFIVGEGVLRGSLQDQIDGAGLGARLRLLGERTDMTELLSLTDVYVRPGIIDGFAGLTVLEAQALAVPVVSFDVPDVRPAITDGQTGLLVPKGDVNALAEAVTTLLDDPTLRHRLGQAGRSHVEVNFSLGAVVDQLESLYRDETMRVRNRRFWRSST